MVVYGLVYIVQAARLTVSGDYLVVSAPSGLVFPGHTSINCSRYTEKPVKTSQQAPLRTNSVGFSKGAAGQCSPKPGNSVISLKLLFQIPIN